MSEDLPVQGTILSSSPCTVQDAAALLGSFLQSDSVPDSHVLRGYLETVSGVLEELASTRHSKRKEKKSRKHRELDHNNADGGLNEAGQEHETRSGLNAAEEAVNLEAGEQQNGHEKGSGKKRKGGGIDGEENANDAKRRKLHLEERDVVGVDAENVELVVRKEKRRKDDSGGYVETNEQSVEKETHSERNDGGVNDVEKGEPPARKHRKRKDRGLDVEISESEVVEKKQRKGIEH